MHFTKLRLKGFKSFVDPTELVIGEGLTAVIGPNGCGKSNLLEALRWVMGENRPTAMRGSGMEDVIFAGSSARSARNSASVELVIDNGARLAPAALNDSDQIEVSRRITRDIGSAYHVNGRPARARDVQMLFADASTGAHSPALVRQGQISELINAKPTARRRVLEEAAGIAGLYQRRHEAALKLNGAQANLARVEDLLEGLETQLRTLDRQAGQARRYREIADQLRRADAVLLLMRWRQAAAERDAAEADLAEGSRVSARAEAAARAASAAREEHEVGLPPLREEVTVSGAVRQRLEIEEGQIAEAEASALEAISALARQAAQLSADAERETALGQDAETAIAKLTAEEAELYAAETGHEAKLARAEEAARTAGERLSAAESRHDRLAEDAARLAARAAAAERRAETARKAHDRLAGELTATRAEKARLEDGLGDAGRAVDDATTHLAAAKARAEAAETALDAAETALAQAQDTAQGARGRLAEADGAAGTLASEVSALERVLAREADGGAKMLDAVSVDPGFEQALGAAIGDDLQAPELSTEADAGTGWRGLAPLPPAPLPEGAAPIAPHVRAPEALARRIAAIGVVPAAEGARLQPALSPGQRLVSREGDLWRWDGYAEAASESGSAAARRLAQRNRLAELQASHAAAAAEAEAARAAHGTAKAALDEASAAEAAARAERRAADQAQAEASRKLTRAEADLEMRRSKVAAQADLLEAREAELAAAEAECAEAEGALAELGDVEAARAAVNACRGEVDEARTAMLAARGHADEIRREAEARARRLEAIGVERASWLSRQEKAAGRIEDLRRRADETEAARKAALGKPDEIAERRAALGQQIATARARAEKAADALAEGEAGQRRAEEAERAAARAASEAREARGRLEGLAEATRQRLAQAAEAIEAELDETPEALSERLAIDPAKVDPKAAEAEVAKLRRQRDALGAVNLRAEEDAREVAAERDGLATEKADLDAAVAKLNSGIQELNREGRQRLTAAFEEVNGRFAELFRHLFGGGEARLVMVESEDPLEAGLEILCQPPGKKLSTLSLLSGGEQTLTALSLILAVFLTNPAPICVLDEVDAPLDDANVVRFCNMLDRMVSVTSTRFLIITHNPITMSRMDRLFGVTMVEQGVSQLVSVDLSRAAEIVGH